MGNNPQIEKLFSQKTVGKQAYLNCWFEDKNATPVEGNLMISTIMSCTYYSVRLSHCTKILSQRNAGKKYKNAINV